MELITLKQFADDQGITYEAVRRQVIRHADKLKGHIVKKNRVQYLDDEAVQILKNRRRESPIVLQTIDQSAEINRLTEQVESLKALLMESQDERLKAQDRIIELQSEANKMLEDRAKYTALLEDNKAKEEQISGLNKKVEDLQRERDAAQKDAQAFQKSFFGFYRKKY